MSAIEPAARHARHMDAIYRHQRFIYNATRRYYLLGRTELIERLNCPRDGHVLEIGCGTAWNLIRIAKRYGGAALYGLDVSEEMLKTARAALARAGLQNRIELAQGDATSFDATALFGRSEFDRIVISYALSMIPGWEQVLTQAANVLSPQGSIHIVDFGRCEGLPMAFRRALYSWLEAFSVTPREDLNQALRDAAESEDLMLGYRSLYRGYAVEAELARGV